MSAEAAPHNHHQTRSPAALKAAFETFNELSDDLARSYRELEGRFGELSQRLEAATDVSARLENLLAALPSAVVVLDRDAIVVECNSAAIALLGTPLLAESWATITRRCFIDPPTSGGVSRLRDERVVEVALRKLSESAGIVVLSDVTETFRLREQAAHQERLSAMGQMAATLAHQLRTPLATMTLYGSRLQATQLPDAERLRLAERLQERMAHMAAQINDMLLYARGGVGSIARFDLEALMLELLLQAQPLVERDGGVLLRRGMQLTGEIAGNREALSGALLNLIDNAVSANPGGEITVSTGIDDGVLTIAVSDHGPGIPAEVLPRIFEPFYTTRSSGSGLGLAVVHTVAAAHGGEVRCHSSPGAGSCFELILPMAANHQPIASALTLAEGTRAEQNTAETNSHA